MKFTCTLQGCGPKGAQQWHQFGSVLLLLRGAARLLQEAQGLGERLLAQSISWLQLGVLNDVLKLQ